MVEDADPAELAPAPELINAPREPVLGPITTAEGLAEVCALLAAGTGVVAVDAERASGYRYSQRAYLVQLFRAGVGNVLLDPIAVPDLLPLQAVIGDLEWVLHAASQDLACLREIGLDPVRIFDTETAGRLLGLERVSLAAMLEHFLDVTLLKGHSAADWSTRPLPADWLVYAALDVELLVSLRDAVAAELDRVGKREWAEQEFAATLAAAPPAPRVEPWRRTSGIHVLRSRRQLGEVRALWEARDAMASSRDIAPGRLLPDSAIVAAVRANPTTAAEMSALPVFKGPRQRKHVARWFEHLEAARALEEHQLPSLAQRSDPESVPPPARWRERDPAAAARLVAVREAIATLGDEHTIQVQNLLAADVIRRLCWQPPTGTDVAAVAGRLAELGARPWQVELTAAPLAEALRLAAAPPTEA